jgi:hypothetical protein
MAVLAETVYYLKFFKKPIYKNKIFKENIRE